MAGQKVKNDVSKLSFEEAIKELTEIVARIEQGQIALQDSLQQYEKGMGLIKHCRTILQEAEKRIEKISESQAKPQEEPQVDPQKNQGVEDLPFT
ncbi:MAG: exodeoxyribonuclease VII small subunit [Planctomycetes bacterium RBG_16_55_9]|nr:MAG: exodeoxyribonuclease VII small subunit [Planctomycetes bacterium RBG_16_55_9]